MTHNTFFQNVLNWFHTNGRKNLPWQKNKTLYMVWISEIMLQQTTVKTVIPYFKKFILRFPTLKSLYLSHLDEILHLWSGLGYYNRARNIYKTANILQKENYKDFPDQFSKIIKLPGIGKSTAGAILSLSQDYFFSILDGNIKRILIRYNDLTILKNNIAAERQLWRISNTITPLYNTGKFNQAMMDIGSLICTPKYPKCDSCPLNLTCKFVKNQKKCLNYSIVEKKTKKNIQICWFILIRYKNYFWMQKNTKKNIWKYLFCFPECTTELIALKWLQNHQISIKTYTKKKSFIHKFSHFVLHVHPIEINLFKRPKLLHTESKGIWYNLDNPQCIGLPRAVKKIFEEYNLSKNSKKENKCIV